MQTHQVTAGGRAYPSLMDGLRYRVLCPYQREIQHATLDEESRADRRFSAWKRAHQVD